MKEHEDEIYSHIIGEKCFYCSIDNECKRFYNQNDNCKVELVPELFGSHLEGDTRVMLHALHADRDNRENIAVRANDTDVAVILVYNVKFIENSNMWYDFGIDSYKLREYLDITKQHKSIDYVDTVPGIYAFTGNDYKPAFYRKGKIKPITLMCKHERFINALKCLGEMPLTSDAIENIEEYTCHLYGYTRQADIHEVIKTHFESKAKPKPNKKPLQCIKNIEPTTFPSCRDVLIQQIKRIWFIAKLYKSASLPHPTEDLTPIDLGSVLEGKFLAIKVPQELENVDYLSESDAEDSDIDESDDEDALEINNDEIITAPLYSLRLQYHFLIIILFYF